MERAIIVIAPENQSYTLIVRGEKELGPIIAEAIVSHEYLMDLIREFVRRNGRPVAAWEIVALMAANGELFTEEEGSEAYENTVYLMDHLDERYLMLPWIVVTLDEFLCMVGDLAREAS